MKLKSKRFGLAIAAAALLAVAILALVAWPPTPAVSQIVLVRTTGIPAPAETLKAPEAPGVRTVEGESGHAEREQRNHPELSLQLE